MRTTHGPKPFWIALLLGIGGLVSSSGRGAIALASLNEPTLQTLIDMGATPVTVGQYSFSHFSFVDASSGPAHTAAQVQVQGLIGSGYGLQFVSNWYATDGSTAVDVITFDVQAPTAATSIGQISLLSNGTAPVPAAGTFTAATLISTLSGGGTAAPVLSTYNDGFTAPVDTTKPDVNYAITSLFPEQELQIIDTLTAVSTPAGSGNTGGVATASVLQNAFIPVTIPEPAQPTWIFLPMAIVVTLSRGRWKTPA